MKMSLLRSRVIYLCFMGGHVTVFIGIRCVYALA